MDSGKNGKISFKIKNKSAVLDLSFQFLKRLRDENITIKDLKKLTKEELILRIEYMYIKHMINEVTFIHDPEDEDSERNLTGIGTNYRPNICFIKDELIKFIEDNYN